MALHQSVRPGMVEIVSDLADVVAQQYLDSLSKKASRLKMYFEFYSLTKPLIAKWS